MEKQTGFGQHLRTRCAPRFCVIAIILVAAMFRQIIQTAASSLIPLSTTTWTAVGPAPIVNGWGPQPVSGRVSGLSAHPTNANIIYIAAAGGGVWKTTNAGINWTPLTDDQATLSMGAIAVAPGNPNVVYAGTGEANTATDSNYGRGILVSTDGGATWALRTAGGQFDRKTVAQIAVDPTNAAVAYAAMATPGTNGLSGNGGIWKTTDFGVNWTNTTTSITDSPYSDIQIAANNPSVLYAAVGLGLDPANGVYKSFNGGISWSGLAGVPSGFVDGRVTIAVSKANSQVIYVSITGTGLPGSSSFGSLFRFMRSDNGGATFTDLTAGTPNYLGTQGPYDTALIVDPTNPAIIYAGGQYSIIKSTNSGESWSDISVSSTSPFNGPHVDHHAFAFDANGKLIDGNDGGVWRLDNPNAGSILWTSLNNEINTIQFQGVGLHPTNPDIALGGSQDNGTSRFTGARGWTLVEGGDGGFVKFSQTNPNRVYHQIPIASFGENFFRRSDNGGLSWVTKNSGITGIQGFYAPFVVDPINGDRVLYGGNQVWETTNGGDTWRPISSPFLNGWTSSLPIDALGLSVSDSNTIYASAFGVFGGNIFFTNSHGAAWSQRNLPVEGRVNDLQVDSENSQTAYAVISGFTTGGNVFRTTNGGITWTNISGNLPNLPTFTLQIDARGLGSTDDVLYVGNDDGVYVSRNLGVSWVRFGVGFPRAQVFQLELNTGLHILAAATHGRGMWEILTDPPSGDTSNFTITALSATPNILKPPDHKMVPVNLRGTTSGGSGAVFCQIINVESNEAVDGNGDGDTAPDWEIIGSLTANLRAERSGNGTGRIYTITVQCTDAPGKSARKAVTVTVPRDQKH